MSVHLEFEVGSPVVGGEETQFLVSSQEARVLVVCLTPFTSVLCFRLKQDCTLN